MPAELAGPRRLICWKIASNGRFIRADAGFAKARVSFGQEFKTVPPGVGNMEAAKNLAEHSDGQFDPAGESTIASPIHTHLAEVVCGLPAKAPGCPPAARIRLQNWTWPHVVAFLVNKYAGGRAVLDGDDIEELPRHVLRDDIVRSDSLIFEGREIAVVMAGAKTPPPGRTTMV